jgi:hypothetical protein
MAIADNIIRIKTNIANTYNILEAKGAVMPEKKNSDYLPICAESLTNSGGGDNDELLNSLIDRSITSVESNVETIGNYAFSNCSKLKEVNLNKAKICNNSAFQNCSSLKTISLPELTFIGNNAFVGCNILQNCNFPKVAEVGTLSFRYCAALSSIYLPSATIIDSQAFQNCNNLTTVRIDKKTTINNLSFGQSAKFETLILTNTDGVSTLSNTTAFTGTKIASGTGYIYVPQSLIEAYKVATNWSTFATQFRAIEDYPDILNIGGVVA